jgi:dTDP-glucose pyrophosphorylase
MTTEPLAAFCVSHDATLLEALAVIDRGAAGLCCVQDDDGRLVAVLSDGDVRRALLAGGSVDGPALTYAQTRPHTVPVGTSRAHVLDLMSSLRITAVPEIDDDRRLRALHTLSDIVGARRLPNRAVIMAGGKGTRLGALTKDVPKPLMTVAGRSIIEWVILGLVGDGITRIAVSVNHLAEQIVDRLGDGTELGCRIEYLRESADEPLGTAGSLTLLAPEETSDDADPIIVLNSDIMVDFDATELLRRHRELGAVMTLGTKTYLHSVPYGVVEVDQAGMVRAIVEKPDLTVEVNAAVYCIDARLVRRLPAGRPSTMPELAELCLAAGEPVAAWDLASEWIDVGTPQDLARAKGVL